MKLYILRHGDAVAHGDPRYAESDRPLTDKGIRQTEQLAAALVRLEVAFDHVFSSPLTRAWQTAEIVARALRQRVESAEALKPDGEIRMLLRQLEEISPRPRSVLVVGHEPYLSTVISLLVDGPEIKLELKKGGLVRLDLKAPPIGKGATLEWLIPPKVWQ
jgi:phosphohistidine phosphatase